MKNDTNKYIIACSGGPDSMALLDLYKSNIVGVCHVNYHKRPDSNLDQQIVQDFCDKHNLKLSVLNVKPSMYKSKQHNFQALAREIRYKFFIKCSKKYKCNNLLVAHNLNDFLETAIMQENRHSLNFFYGIREKSKYENLDIYRPLIKTYKSDLQKYCDGHAIPYAIDSSNNSDIYERNRIRKQLNKKSKKQLSLKYRQIAIRNFKQEKLEKKFNLLLNQWEKNGYPVIFIKSLKPEYANRLIYLYLKNNKIININYNKIKLVRDFIVSKKSNHQLRLEEKVYLLKKDKKICLKN